MSPAEKLTELIDKLGDNPPSGHLNDALNGWAEAVDEIEHMMNLLLAAVPALDAAGEMELIARIQEVMDELAPPWYRPE